MSDPPSSGPNLATPIWPEVPQAVPRTWEELWDRIDHELKALERSITIYHTRDEARVDEHLRRALASRLPKLRQEIRDELFEQLRDEVRQQVATSMPDEDELRRVAREAMVAVERERTPPFGKLSVDQATRDRIEDLESRLAEAEKEKLVSAAKAQGAREAVESLKASNATRRTAAEWWIRMAILVVGAAASAFAWAWTHGH